MIQGRAPRRIAIDGPAAAGKSAVGAAVARRLGFTFIDTGAIYRALTWLVLEQNVNPNDSEAVAGIAASAAISVAQEQNGATSVVINQQEVTSHLRDAGVEAAVSAVSAIPAVRRHLIDVQRRLGDRDVVMAGRDIGSVVLPDAELKIFLDASSAERAKRRLAETRTPGDLGQLAELEAQLERRDRVDSSRSVSPLVVPDGAVRLETDGLTLQQVIDRLLELARRRWPELAGCIETAPETQQRR